MRRRFLFIFAALLAAVVLAVASLPLWLGVVARRVGPSYGLTFAGYERIGYGRFALRDAEFRRGPTRVTVSRAEADTPLVWLWHRWTKRPNLIVGDRWLVEVSRRPPGEAGTVPATPASRPAEGAGAGAVTATSRRGGWVPLRGLLRRIADQLDHWLPEAKVGAGEVRWPGGGLTLASATWAKRELVVENLAIRALNINGRLAFPADADAMRLAVRMTDEANSATLESRGNAITGEVVWWEQQAAINAAFAEAGWIPSQASIQAESWNIPGARVKVGELYSAIRGHARLDWREDHFTADVVFKGEPVEGKKMVPPLDVNVQGRGDAQMVTIESLQAALPGVKAHLSDPITIERSGKFREGTARFAVEADLSQQPWFAAQGQVHGEARLVSGAAESPNVEFQLAARNVVAHELSVSAIDVRGRFLWPQVQVTAGSIVGGEGERLDVRGGWDFRAKTILDAVVQGQIRRGSLARWLPAQPEFDVVSLKAEMTGAVADVGHKGNAEADGVKISGVPAAAITLEWSGHGARIESFASTARIGSTSVSAAGSAELTGVHLDRFELAQGAAVRLQLKERATIRWQPALQIESLHLAGPEGSIDAAGTWGDVGRIELAARNINSSWLDELWPAQPFKWRLTLLAITGNWDRGPMAFSVSGGAEVELGDGHVAAVMAAARGDKDGVRLEALRATEGEATVLNATGRIPVVLRPRGQPFVQIDENGALTVEASAAPNAAFWQQFATATGVELKDPQASARLGGTWLRPQGDFRLNAARVAMNPERFKRPIPDLEKLEVQVSGDRDGVQLQKFSMAVEGQSLRASGRLPIPDGGWNNVIKQPLATVQRGADARLEIPDADVAAFARFLPAYIAPIGRVQVDVAYKNGGLDGFLRLRDAASRPLGPLGVLQEINAEIQLTGRRLELRGVTAKSGGQPIALTGKIEMPAGERPRYDFVLQGDNLPFVRQAGLLMRGDLDLKLETPATGAPRISGSVRLRDSLFLSDVRSFIPQGGGTTTRRRPPYFALETPPLDTWGLAVDVTGDRFLRLRTPVFNGVASAHFRLGGTLGEPRAIGELTVDEGLVLMPFASFEIRQGAVRLTEADPYEPAVFVRGTGRRFGYDLTMEIEGAATSPNVILSSSPALNSEQVLLMVMTGAPPSNEITVSATQRVTRIGTFLGQSILGSLGADAVNADRLSIASGEKISRQGKETYEIEYKLSDRLTVMGEYNEFDEHNAGIKWRVFPRKREAEAPPDETK